MDIRNKNSVLTEWILKFAVIFFVASLFFESYISQTLGAVGGLSLGFLVKIIVVLIYGIFLSVLEKNIFKIAAFTTIIIGSLFKILIYISQTDFNLLKITELADFILLICVSVYYLQRHFRKSKKKKQKQAETRHHKYHKNPPHPDHLDKVNS